MRQSNYEAVEAVYEHFGLLADLGTGGDSGEPGLISPEQVEFRLKFLREEMTELERAYRSNDLVEIADALVDLVVIAMGTARLHCLPWDELFAEVCRSNMDKVRGINPPGHKREGQVDLIKPPGWTPPDLRSILVDHGWEDLDRPA